MTHERDAAKLCQFCKTKVAKLVSGAHEARTGFQVWCVLLPSQVEIEFCMSKMKEVAEGTVSMAPEQICQMIRFCPLAEPEPEPKPEATPASDSHPLGCQRCRIGAPELLRGDPKRREEFKEACRSDLFPTQKEKEDCMRTIDEIADGHLKMTPDQICQVIRIRYCARQ